MANAQLGAVIRCVRGLAAAQHAKDQTDEDLLCAFLAQNDQAAFTAMVKRHGPLVLGVCRRVLHHFQDAEDAFQATFLLLVRKAASIRKKESLSSWLHGAAYRMAMHAKRAALRRRKHEERTNPMPSPSAAGEVVWREVQSILDEEIGRLPELYRQPFILCCLENKGRMEVARQLGLNEATVRSRLAHARKLLQQRLGRRGVSLSILSGALALSENTAGAAVSNSLVSATVKAALAFGAGHMAGTGVISAPVAALVERGIKTMFVTKLKVATAMLLAVGIAAGAGLLTHQVFVEKSAEATQPAASQALAQDNAKTDPVRGREQARGKAPQREGEDVIKVRGRVLDPDGKPLAGAKQYLGGYTSLEAPAYPVRTTSGDDGRFAFTFARSELQQTDADDSVYQVLAVAKDYGCAWVTADAAAQDLNLRLVKDEPVSGRIIDTDGKPVVGATLTVTGVCLAKSPDYFAEAIRAGSFSRAFAMGWVGPLPGQPTVMTTGADGKFRLAGVGRDRAVGFRVEGRGIATEAVTAHGASFEYRAAVSRPIRGVVRDRATGSPLAGATLVWQFTYNKRYEIMPWRYRMATTDKNGHYELLGAPKSPQSLDRYSASYLAIRPAIGQPYLQQTVQVKDTPGLDPMTVDINLVRGPIAVSGKITDKATGKPIAGAMVEYFPLHANPNAVKLPSFSWPRSEATTGPDGSYVLTVLPCQGVLGVLGPRPDAYMPAYLKPEEIKAFFKTPLFGKGDSLAWSLGDNGIDPFFFAGGTCNALVLLEPGENEQTLVKDVALERAQELKGRVIGPDGEPLAGMTVWGLTGHDIETLKGAEFTARRINPRAPRELVFHHKEKNFGFFLKELPTEKDRPLIVHLQPCGSAAGRILDQDGQPVANMGVAFAGIRQNTLRRDWQLGVTTDKEGRFRVDGLVPGMPYSVYCGPGSNLTNVWGEPGKCKDLGDLRTKSN